MRRSDAIRWRAKPGRRSSKGVPRPGYRYYMPEEDAYLRTNCGRLPWRAIAAHLDRSVNSLQNRRRLLERREWQQEAAQQSA